MGERERSMQTNAFVVMILVGAGLLGCGGSNSGDSDGGTNPGPALGKVTGIALDSQGHPLAGAEITVCNPVFFDSCVGGTTGADGHYSVDLQPTNVWTVYASIKKTYDGKTYCLDLSPTGSTDTFSSSDGAVRNFQWKLTGQRPGESDTTQFSSFYGAGLSVVDDTGNFVMNDKYIEVTLVPDGPLVDGSAGSTVTLPVGNWNSYEIGNIPLGRYTVSADYAPPNGAKSALLVGTSSFGQYTASTVLDFDPDQGGTCGNPEATVHVVVPH
jgi:hypothetical protein